MGRRGGNEGSIYRRGDGYWVAAISLGGGRRQTFYGKTRIVVAQKVTTVLRARQQGYAQPQVA